MRFRLARTYLLPLLCGILVAFSGMVLDSFFRLAYGHSALSEEWLGYVVSLLAFIEWPCRLLESIGLPEGVGDYTHSHVSGHYFWTSLMEYLATVGLGWASVFICLRFFAEFFWGAVKN